MLDFTDKVVVVTGGGSGIGAAVAEGFGRCGATGVVHHTTTTAGADTAAAAVVAAGGKARTVSADLTDAAAASAQVEDVLATEGRIDVLVNNAGDLVRRSPIAELSDEDFHRIMDLNVTSAFAMCRKAIPSMVERGSGAIINLTSIAARTGGAGGSVLYATSKGAVSTFTRGLGKELARTGVRVNALAPGVITTPFHDRHTSAEQMDAMVNGIPMGRTGRPEECVGTVLFLASDAMSSYVTGQIIEVNGGQLTP
jgi:3-oxoacyl-[acyl-carrier protein] reductase